MSDSRSDTVDLEIQVAHLQRLYEQLNDVVTEQAMEADRMRRKIAQLESQIKQLKEKPSPAADPLDEKPPHY
jgi:uncharacterized coiled-coil protein SlyX